MKTKTKDVSANGSADSITDLARQIAAPIPQIPKSRLWLFYARDAYTTARHMQAALEARPTLEVLGIGPGHAFNPGQRVDLSAIIKQAGYSPDVVCVMDGCAPMEILGLESFKGPKLLYLLDTHLKPERPEFAQYDRVFVAHRQTLALYSGAIWLPHAADPELHKELPLPRVYDVAFVGGTDLAEVHWRRRKLLRALIESGMTVWAGRTTGLWLSFIYSKSRLVFNCTVKGDLNMRVFEGAMCRRLVLNDRPHPEAGYLESGWEDGKTIVYYDDE